MSALPVSGSPTCPICSGTGDPLLSLLRRPIYQHPVAPDVNVPTPHTVDLAWTACTTCAHAWQPEFDAGLLEEIYRGYYYTPAPDGVGVQFREEFLAVMERLGMLGPRRVLLEIGASSGDVLAELKRRTGAARSYAFEPNSENAVLARERGLDVRERFFTGSVVAENLDAADLIYARHVIEHIFDFDDFFAGLAAVATPAADLALETPSLDFHASQGSLAPFHIEHIHVFALRSLGALASRHGWGLRHAEVTRPGNLVAVFRRGVRGIEVPKPKLDSLQHTVSKQQERLRRLLAERQLVFWGAGSSGVSLVSILGREPDIWTDGNPNKVGKRFAGLQRKIVSPDAALAEVRSRKFTDPALVITSSFVNEILPRVRQLGWVGDVYDDSGKRLDN